MHALVCADRDRPLHMHQRFIVPRRQRLFDQRHAGPVAGIEIGGEVVRRPSLIGIDDQLRFWSGAAHGLDACHVVVAAELDLEQWPMGRFRGGGGHRVGCAERDCIGRGAGGRCRSLQQVPDALTALPGFEIEQGAVHGIARRPMRHGGLQGVAAEPRGKCAGHGLNRRQRRLRRLAIAGIGHTFAAAGVAAAADLGHHHHRLGLGAAADGETAGDRPGFDTGGQCRRGRGCSGQAGVLRVETKLEFAPVSISLSDRRELVCDVMQCLRRGLWAPFTCC